MKNDPRLKMHELGFLELREKPSLKELGDYYEEKYYQNESAGYRKSYSELEANVINLRVMQRAAMARSFMGSTSNGRILDVGCGEGFALSHFHALGWQVSGIDFSRAGVEQMNPHCLPFVQQGDIFLQLEHLISGNEKYNIVWLSNVLEHVLDPVLLLNSLRQLIEPDGLLVVTVPNDGNIYHESLFESGDIPHRFWIAIPDHISYFTKESLNRIATATNWDCLALQGDFPIDWYLANECSNHIIDRQSGSSAHKARLRLEQLIGLAGIDAANRFYSSLAEVGFGRNLTAYLRPQSI